VKNISKLVVSKNDGRQVGYVVDLVVDFETFVFEGYVVVDEETEEELFVALSDCSLTGDFVLVEDATKLVFMPDRKSLIGKRVCSREGVDLGVVKTIVVENKKCKKLVTEKGEIATKLVGFVGEDVVFVGKKKRVSQKMFSRVEREPIVKSQEIKNFEPAKVTLSTSYYIGKLASEDVYGFNNERIVLKGEKITKQVLEKVKKHNRLNQLFFAIKKD